MKMKKIPVLVNEILIDRKDEHHLKINESSKNTDKMGILEQVSDFFTSNLQATTNQKPTNVISEMQNNLCEMEKVIVMSSTEQLSSESKLEKLDNVIVGKAEVTNKHCQDNLNITDKNLLHEQAVSRSIRWKSWNGNLGTGQQQTYATENTKSSRATSHSGLL